MKLKYLVKESNVNENIINKYLISRKAKKLILRLEAKKDFLSEKIPNSTGKEKREIKSMLKTIDKALPIIENFEKYFNKLEINMTNSSDEEKIKRIQSKYDEIKALFLDKLYNIMLTVSYRPALLIASAIAGLIISLLFLHPGGIFMILPTIMFIKRIRDNKEIAESPKFKKEIDKVLELLEKKKKQRF